MWHLVAQIHPSSLHVKTDMPDSVGIKLRNCMFYVFIYRDVVLLLESVESLLSEVVKDPLQDLGEVLPFQMAL